MSDRELLELAARAAGIEFQTTGEEGSYDDRKWWNPLTDDGDALRLAVRLNLRPVFHPVLNQAIVKRYSSINGDPEWVENGEDHSDPYTATRRAIVRAAAEIGRNMP